MYAQLGDIKFQQLKGFDAFRDTKEANYAEHALIENKPVLQRVGTKLQELSLTITFHKAFCNPEQEYKALDDYRENGDILPLVYGNGTVEGSFVIVSISKQLEKTDNFGNYIHIVCELSLKEYYDPDKPKTKLKQAQREAFAVNVNRPLPINAPNLPQSPAMQSAVDLKEAQKASDIVAAQNADFKKQTNRLSDLFDKAEKFRDMAQVSQSKLVAKINTVDSKLLRIQDTLNVYPSLALVAPNLQDALTAARESVGNARNTTQEYVSIPGAINTTIEATYTLDIMNNSITASDALSAAMKELKKVFAPMANFIASRK